MKNNTRRRIAQGRIFDPELNQVRQMTPAEYREAWAWVHLMLRSRPDAKAVLTQYLQQLRVNPSPGPLQPRLANVFADPDEALAQHIRRTKPEEPNPKSEEANSKS